MSARSLAERLAPFEDAQAENWARIGQIVAWLRESPHARQDLRQQKLDAWQRLQAENTALDAQMERVWEAWLKERANRPVGMAEAVADVLRGVAAAQGLPPDPAPCPRRRG